MKTKIILVLTMLLCHYLIFSSFAIAKQDTLIQEAEKVSKLRALLIKKVQNSVVHIKVEQNITANSATNNPYDLFNNEFFERFFPEQRRQPNFSPPEQRQYRREGMGSGSIISEQGYILTNHHVVGKADKILVKLFDGRELPAKLVGTDPLSDIAVIQIDQKNLLPLPIGNSEKIDVGESVIAIGNPFGLSHTVTFGIISAKGRSNIGIIDYEDFIQTDAAINPGNSGGPLINLRGEIIGINTAIFSRSGGYQGIGFAVSINFAKRIMEDLIENGNVSRGWLGVSIQDMTVELAKVFGVENQQGTLVSGVIQNTPAAKAGLKKGDVITQVDQISIRNANHLRNQIATMRGETTVMVKLIRNRKELVLPVTLGTRPNAEDQLPVNKPPEIQKGEYFGIRVQPLTRELAQRFGYTQDRGVIIRQVQPNSVAERAGLVPGMLIVEINRVTVRSLKDFEEAMEQANLEESVLLLINSQRGSQYIILKKE